VAIRRFVGEILDFIDKRYIIHRFMSLVGLYLTVHSYLWAIHFAESTARPGVEIAAIIAAITAPISLLQANMFKTYSEHRAATKKMIGSE
jgi:hypothetical protein